MQIDKLFKLGGRLGRISWNCPPDDQGKQEGDTKEKQGKTTVTQLKGEKGQRPNTTDTHTSFPRSDSTCVSYARSKEERCVILIPIRHSTVMPVCCLINVRDRRQGNVSFFRYMFAKDNFEKEIHGEWVVKYIHSFIHSLLTIGILVKSTGKICHASLDQTSLSTL